MKASTREDPFIPTKKDKIESAEIGPGNKIAHREKRYFRK